MTIKLKPIVKNNNFCTSGVKIPHGLVKHQLFIAQKGMCFHCNKFFQLRLMTKDHLFPKRYGFTGIGNIVLACENCNIKKSDLLPSSNDICRAVELWNKYYDSKRSVRQTRFNVVATKNGKPRFKLLMTAQDIEQWSS